MFDEELAHAPGRPGIGSAEYPRARLAPADDRPRAARRLRSMDDAPTAARAIVRSSDAVRISPDNVPYASDGYEAGANVAQEMEELARLPRPEAEVQTLVTDWFTRTGLDAAIAAARRCLQQDRDAHPEPDSRIAALDAMLTELERVRILDLEGLRRALAFARLAARVPPEPWKVPDWAAFLAGFCPHSAATPPAPGAPFSSIAIVRVDETAEQLYLYVRRRPLLISQRSAALYAPDVVVARAVHAAAVSAPEDRRIQLARQQLAISAPALKLAIDNICRLNTPHIPVAVPRSGVFLWAHGEPDHPLDVPAALGAGLDLSKYMTAVCCDAFDRRERAYTPAAARARADELYRECHARYRGFVWDELPRGDVPDKAFVAVQGELLAPPASFDAHAPPPLPEPFVRITAAQEWTDDTRECFLAAVAHAVLLAPVDRAVLDPEFQRVLLMPNLIVIDGEPQTGKSVLMDLIAGNTWRPPLAMEMSEDQFASAGVGRPQSLIDLGDQKLDGWGAHKIRDALRWSLKYCDQGAYRVRLMRTDTFAPETQVPSWRFGQPRRADIALTTNARLGLPWENMRRMMYFTHPTPRARLTTDTRLEAQMRVHHAALLLRAVHAFHARLLVRGRGERNAMWSPQQDEWVAALLTSQSVIMRFAKDMMVRRKQDDMSLDAAKLWLLGCAAPVCIDKVFWARFKEWTDKLPPADRPWLQATKESVKKDLAPTGIELLCTNEGEYLPFFEWTATAQAADEFGFNRGY